MGWQLNCQQRANKLLTYPVVIQPFYTLTITLLSLLLPLSFLLLARLSCYNYLLNVIESDVQNQPPLLFFLFISTNPSIIYVLVFFVSGATLVHGLTGKITLLSEAPGASYKPRLYAAWILLCTLQTCVGLGIEGSIAAGIDGSSFNLERSLLSRVIFFLGLHETMLHWSRTVVKPVVDDTVFGVARDERWIQRLAMALSFGTLWWWRLRGEIESMVVAAEAKRGMLIGSLGLTDLLGWCLYYLTVTIGMVRAVKGLMWVAMVLLCRRVTRESDRHGPRGDDDKV